MLQPEIHGYWAVFGVGEIMNQIMACGQQTAFPTGIFHFHHYSIKNGEVHPSLQELCPYLLQPEMHGYWAAFGVGEIANLIMACGQQTALPPYFRPFP